ncbi:hypothetical protein Swoo_0680 [Shewanella woodyi ATCC 51908]|uniref:Uncharacterized protein n=1 Tax=Shewanella woodyi (strain ATCC 51908 / MS32) TaxID=392500 RepID=B1KDH5_SHEWM|nr:hypothetical protein Swoo_0680 [Shewanella woodyi ATCC 51908]
MNVAAGDSFEYGTRCSRNSLRIQERFADSKSQVEHLSLPSSWTCSGIQFFNHLLIALSHFFTLSRLSLVVYLAVLQGGKIEQMLNFRYCCCVVLR